MAISFTRYVDITSGVSGAATVRMRELITRIFSSNPLIPTNSFAEFTSSDDVGSYFGTTSEEYKRALYYFSFLSKTITAPQKISFSSWVQTAVAPIIYGSRAATATLAALNLITAGAINLTLGAVTVNVTGLNFSSAGSLAAVATAIQTAVRAASVDANWATATVTYDATNGRFVLTGGAVATTAQIPVVIAPATGTDAAIPLGWEDINTIYSYGSPAMSLTDTMIASGAASNNFATFCYIPALTTAQILELQTWNNGQNITYMGLYRVNSTIAAATSSAIMELAGGAMTLAPLAAEYPEMLPGAILAATDYTRRNVSQNYMYQQSDLTPSVSSDDSADAYDALRTNYYGVTQSAGQLVAFYQRGVLTGGSSAPTDMNIYANEIWFKSSAGVALLTLFLAVNQVSTNPGGRSQILATLQPVIDQAIFNGVISVGKQLTSAQQLVITQISGDPKAWYQVQNIGYWLDVTFPPGTVTVDDRTEYTAQYTLIYAKNDAIRKVVGSHVLI